MITLGSLPVDVMAARTTSGPRWSIRITAGLFFAFERSENGKGTTTTSPFIDPSKPRLLLESSR